MSSLVSSATGGAVSAASSAVAGAAPTNAHGQAGLVAAALGVAALAL